MMGLIMMQSGMKGGDYKMVIIKRESKMEYIVWVGGTIVYEDNNKNEAEYIGDKYISWGYDDVIIEKVVND